MQSQAVGPAVEVAGVEHRERMVDNVAESGLADEAFELGLAVVADEAFPRGVDRWGCLPARFHGDGVCPVERRAVADRNLGLRGEAGELAEGRPSGVEGKVD